MITPFELQMVGVSHENWGVITPPLAVLDKSLINVHARSLLDINRSRRKWTVRNPNHHLHLLTDVITVSLNSSAR